MPNKMSTLTPMLTQDLSPEFLDRVRAYAYRCAVNRGCNPDDANDAAQESVLKVWRRAGSYKPDNAQGLTEFQWYAYIARGAVSLYWARKVRTADIPAEIAEQETPDLTSEQGLAAWDAQQVRNAVEQLQEPDRTVIKMILEDVAPEQIATALGWAPDGSMFRRVRRRAYADLRAGLAGLVG